MTVRVIVGLSGSLGSVTALREAVAVAAGRGAVLVPVAAWTPEDGPRPLSELEHAARRRLDTAFEQAVGGYPAGLRVHPVVVRAEAGPALVAAVTGPDDLILLGAGSRHHRLRPAGVVRYCRAHAHCEVRGVEPSLEPLVLV